MDILGKFFYESLNLIVHFMRMEKNSDVHKWNETLLDKMDRYSYFKKEFPMLEAMRANQAFCSSDEYKNKSISQI